MKLQTLHSERNNELGADLSDNQRMIEALYQKSMKERRQKTTCKGKNLSNNLFSLETEDPQSTVNDAEVLKKNVEQTLIL